MSDRKVKGYHRIATGGIHKREGRGVGALGVGDTVNPSQGIADILNIGV